ncbi:uncharacterized protein LOC127811324 [Diospyros lotus]|uniref:uncharacterized protein LOC127811324 n=1 Tax=Diospyros lotus TaxID=55363 RepID=UPI00224EEE0D|nr:uncharacterized protein LOC127811324 [Diospyros lotus]XP_052207035.1 uncharacterized protein LOC127811324 [Diospyros lotus]
MSRCFPFPPPGYEKKARDDDDLLKKEKHQEKKHKKEKKDKDKDKRIKKEKREKDRSDRKHRDSKEKKEKHSKKKKDKEKERGKDKDKDKSGTSGEKGIVAQSESYSGEKLNQKEKESDTDKSSVSDGRKHILQLQSCCEEEPNRNILFAEGTGESKFEHQSGRKIKDEEKGTGSLLVERFSDTKRKNDGQMDRLLVKDIAVLAGGKEKNKDKRPESRMISRQGLMVDLRSEEQAVVQKLAAVVQNGVGGLPRPLEKYSEGRMEQKSRQSEGVDKQKDNGREKKNNWKDKDKKKEKKKEKVEGKSEHKHKEQNRFKGSNMNANLNNQIIRTLHVPGDGERNTAGQVNLKKRKDLQVNGICPGTDVSPNKILKSSPHLSMENGRKLEPCQTSILFSSDRQGSSCNARLDNKACKVNGTIDAKPLSISSKKTYPASTHVNQIAPASTKPPHPDTKYLGQVLSVPKMEDWSELDDQEWLYSSKDHLEGKADVRSAGITETPRVWSDAMWIESADVCALPYVIPY